MRLHWHAPPGSTSCFLAVQTTGQGSTRLHWHAPPGSTSFLAVSTDMFVVAQEQPGPIKVSVPCQHAHLTVWALVWHLIRGAQPNSGPDASPATAHLLHAAVLISSDQGVGQGAKQGEA